MRKKEKNNREKKNGYAHDEWLKRKAERNLTKAQIWVPTTEEHRGHWGHIRAGEGIAVLVP